MLGIPWYSIVGAYRVSSPEGLQIATSTPPYIKSVSPTDSRWEEHLAELARRGLLAEQEAVRAEHDRLLSRKFESELPRMFPGSEAEAALRILDRSPATRHPRMRLALLTLSEGDLAALETWCERAAVDSRDVLMAAWYE